MDWSIGRLEDQLVLHQFRCLTEVFSYLSLALNVLYKMFFFLTKAFTWPEDKLLLQVHFLLVLIVPRVYCICSLMYPLLPDGQWGQNVYSENICFFYSIVRWNTILFLRKYLKKWLKLSGCSQTFQLAAWFCLELKIPPLTVAIRLQPPNFNHFKKYNTLHLPFHFFKPNKK